MYFMRRFLSLYNLETMKMHLSSEAIIDSFEGHGGSKHATECLNCNRQVEEWRQFHARLQKTQLQDAPEAVLQDARGILEPRKTIGEVLSSLIFDSFKQPAFAGARGSGMNRQVVFRVDD